MFIIVSLQKIIQVGQLSQYSDSLRAGRSGDRIPVRARFSAPVQADSGAHPASYTMVTWSLSGVERPGRGVDHPPLLVPRLKKEHSCTSLPLWAFVTCFKVIFIFTITIRLCLLRMSLPIPREGPQGPLDA